MQKVKKKRKKPPQNDKNPCMKAEDPERLYQREVPQEHSLWLWKVQAAISSVPIKSTNTEKSSSRQFILGHEIHPEVFHAFQAIEGVETAVCLHLHIYHVIYRAIWRVLHAVEIGKIRNRML